MNCPACNKILAPTLSVCPSCGTMVKDTVREELAFKISPMAKSDKIEKEKAEIISRAEKAKAEIWRHTMPPLKIESIVKTAPSSVEPEPKIISKPPVAANITETKFSSPISEAAIPSPPPEPISVSAISIVKKPETSELTVKPTSPTLVEFQTKNAVLPEWRLQLQNSVRRRTGNTQADAISSAPVRQTVLATNGATALKVEPVEQPVSETSANPTLEKALKRIEESRQKFLAEEKPAPSPFDAFQPQQRTFPYAVPNNPQESSVKFAQPNPVFTTKPKAAAPILTEVKAEKFDTNKLPPLPEKVAWSFETSESEKVSLAPKIEEKKYFQIKAVEEPEVLAYEEPEVEEFYKEDEADDRAPLSLRFNAALFDLIIGSFISVVLLAPFMLSSGNLFTFQGLFAFLATCSIVMFIYLTTTIGTMGRTYGMRLFSLEIIDIEENAYPTFHQAAVNSSLYLISLALGGLGFVTLFLNHEKRAAHDLLSGTIVVKEYE